MKTTLKSFILALVVMMLCLPATGLAEPSSKDKRPHSPPSAVHQPSHQVIHQSSHQAIHQSSHRVTHHSNRRVARQCGMSDSEFTTFMSLVEKATFRRNQLELIKSAAASNSFTVSQIMQTMGQMAFDSDKVEVAEAMYKNVCDYNNWYMVYSVFNFDRYSRDLKNRLGLP